MGYNAPKLSKVKVDSNLNLQNLYTIRNMPAPVLPADLARLGDITLSNLSIDANKNWLVHLLKNLGDPVDAQDAATRAYVLTQSALFLALTGGTMSGDIAMGTKKITGLSDPADPQDAATRAFVLANAGGGLGVLFIAEGGVWPAATIKYLKWGTSSCTTTESYINKLPINKACKAKNMYVLLYQGAGEEESVTLTLRKNGVDTLLTVTISNEDTSGNSGSTEVSFAAGDAISIKALASDGSRNVYGCIMLQLV